MSGIQPHLLLTQGYVGYFLGSFTDFGPELILVSPQIQERMELSDEILTNFSISILTMTGTYDTSVGKVSLLPITAAEGLVAVSCTFLVKNPELEDERLVEGTPTVFAVLIPSIITLGLKNLPMVLSIVLEQVDQKETLAQIAEPQFLKDLTMLVLRKVLW